MINSNHLEYYKPSLSVKMAKQSSTDCLVLYVYKDVICEIGLIYYIIHSTSFNDTKCPFELVFFEYSKSLIKQKVAYQKCILYGIITCDFRRNRNLLYILLKKNDSTKGFAEVKCISLS